MGYSDYEKEAEIIEKENEKYLEAFEHFLKEDGLSDKTVRQHLLNVSFYINDFLCYYEPTRIKEGCYKIDEFLGDWFIRKAMWSSRESIKNNCASMKKFYKVMLNLGYIEAKDFNALNDLIKYNKESWLESVDNYWSFDIE